jgi:hypothetical protein
MSSSLGDTTAIELSRLGDSSYCSISNYITAWKEHTWAIPPIIPPNPSEVIRRLSEFCFTNGSGCFRICQTVIPQKRATSQQPETRWLTFNHSIHPVTLKGTTISLEGTAITVRDANDWKLELSRNVLYVKY